MPLVLSGGFRRWEEASRILLTGRGDPRDVIGVSQLFHLPRDGRAATYRRCSGSRGVVADVVVVVECQEGARFEDNYGSLLYYFTVNSFC